MPLNTFADSGLGSPATSGAGLSVLVPGVILVLGLLILLIWTHMRLSKKIRALEAYETNRRLMDEHLPDIAIFQLACLPDGTFSFRHLGKGCESLQGLDRARTMADARLAFERIYEADIPTLREAYRRDRKKPGSAKFDIRMMDNSGHPRWMRISAVALLEHGTLIWDGFVQDITDSKNTEDALVEETKNFLNLFETIDDLLLVWDSDGNLLHANQSVMHKLGYAYDELSRMSLFDLYPEPLRAEARQVIDLMKTEQTTTCNLSLQKKDGETIVAEKTIFQGLWKNKKAIFGVIRDMTIRQQTENALRESQKMLQLILNTIPLSVFWEDKNSVYLGCNKSFIRECGLATFDDVVGKTPYDLFDAKTAKMLVDRDQQMMATNQPLFNMLESHPGSGDSTGWRETSKIPLRNEEGCAVGILGVWRDVTERKNTEERLKHTLEDMERFNQLMCGRERRTLELKGEINHLLQKLGQPIKYQTATNQPDQVKP